MNVNVNRSPFSRPSFAPLLLAFLATAILLGGCQHGVSSTNSDHPVLVAPPAFVVQWDNDLQLPDLRGNPITELHVRANKLFAYTRNGTSYVITRTGPEAGMLEHWETIEGGNARLYPPVLLKDWIVYTTYSKLQVYDLHGAYLRAITTNGSIRAVAIDDEPRPLSNAYISLATPGASRVCRYDMAQLAQAPAPALGLPYPNVANGYVWALQSYHGAISGAPAVFSDIIYVGDEEGFVSAVAAENREPVWSIGQEGTPTQGMFNARSRIITDLKADESGVYVPTSDGKFYCINRNTGKVKWQYFAKVTPLDKPATLMSDTVYLEDGGLGIVALDKVEAPRRPGSIPQFNRSPRWASQSIKQVLAQDEHYTFARRLDNTIVAMDKKTGESIFANKRTDFTVFATNSKDGIVYVATRDGHILALKTVVIPGVVGRVARAGSTTAGTLKRDS